MPLHSIVLIESLLHNFENAAAVLSRLREVIKMKKLILLLVLALFCGCQKQDNYQVYQIGGTDAADTQLVISVYQIDEQKQPDSIPKSTVVEIDDHVLTCDYRHSYFDTKYLTWVDSYGFHIDSDIVFANIENETGKLLYYTRALTDEKREEILTKEQCMEYAQNLLKEKTAEPQRFRCESEDYEKGLMVTFTGTVQGVKTNEMLRVSIGYDGTLHGMGGMVGMFDSFDKTGEIEKLTVDSEASLAASLKSLKNNILYNVKDQMIVFTPDGDMAMRYSLTTDITKGLQIILVVKE